LSTAAVASADPRTFELRGGHWPEISTPTSQPSTQPTLQPPVIVDTELTHIESLLSQGEYSYARKRGVIWLLANKQSPLRDRGLFLEAQALFGYGNRVKAYFYLDELMDEYPESNLFTRALEMQYQIADDYLNGYKRRLLGLPLLSAEEEGVEMMYRIQQRSPGSPLAERALLRTADYYFSDGQYDLSADTYAAYAKDYPRSEKLPRVRLREAFSNLAQFRGLRFDATPVIDARAQLVRIMEQFPDEAQSENLAEVLQRIDETFARKLYGVADFYTRTHEPKAAVYTFRYLVNTYPDSPEARAAQSRLSQMPQWALNQPEPAGGDFGVPSSQPSGAP
jgi:outer membrane assembly lipoprotein YfiO